MLPFILFDITSTRGQNADGPESRLQRNKMRVTPAVLAIAALSAFSAGAATFTVTTNADSGAGSLRQAIVDANAAPYDGNPVIIAFSLPADQTVIRPLTNLPVFSNYNALIDGTTQSGYTTRPVVEIDGSLIPGASIGVDFGGSNVAITKCYIGLTPSGARKANGTGVVAGYGTVGGSAAADRNIISGNTTYGVRVTGNDVRVDGNYIGTDPSGSVAIPNDIGIEINGASASIGAYDSIGNLIAGNSSYQVRIRGARAASVWNNIVGLATGSPGTAGFFVDASSASVINHNTIRNQNTGVLVTGGSQSIRIGWNSIYKSRIAIDLSSDPLGDGPTLNDPGDGDSGPNALLNYAVVQSATATSNGVKLHVLIDSKPSSYMVQYFANSTNCGRTGTDGGSWIGLSLMTVPASGILEFDQLIQASLPVGTSITATLSNMTNTDESTSEYSPCTFVAAEGTFSASSPVVTEGGTASVVITRSEGSTGDASLAYATADDSAIAGSDYSPVSGRVTFASGETSKTINVPILDDSTPEGEERFAFQLSQPIGGVVISQPTSYVTIIDNDAPPTFSVAKIEVTEGNSGTTPATFVVKLSQASSGTAVVSYNTVNGSAQSPADFQAASGTLTFAPGETEKNITVLLNGDRTWEPNEEFSIQLTAQSGAAGTATNTCTIVNDDPQPQLSIQDATVVEGNSGTKSVALEVRATAPFTGNVTVATSDLSARGASDYVPAFETLTFSDETVKTFMVAIVGDTEVEADETLQVKINGPVAGATIAKDTAIITIVNDDIGIGPRSQSVAIGSKAKIAITLGKPATTEETITIVSSNPAALSAPASVVIATGSSSVTFSVTALDGPATARIEVTLPASLGGGTLSVTVSSYTPLKLELSPSPLTIVAGQSANITATVTPAPVNPLIIAMDTSDSAVVDVPSSITIPASGSVTFATKGLRAGLAVIRATTPPQYGAEVATLFANVVEAPSTPSIFSVSPATGPTAGGMQVVIGGARLQSACVVTFGETPAQTTFISETQLTAIAPPHAAGTVPVRLTCGSESLELANAFTYLAAGPTLERVSPSLGNIAGGTIVQLTGTNLTSACGVFFDGTAARGVQSDGTTSALTAIAPPHIAGSVEVTVRCSASMAPHGATYNYTSAEEPSPSISDVAPLSGSPGQTVTIRGSRFRIGDVVAFGGKAARVLSTTGDVHVVSVPELAPGKTDIALTDPNGRVTTTGPIFTITEVVAPRITAAAPTTVMTGSELVIDGEGFRFGDSFTLGDRVTTPVLMTWNRAVIRIPALAAGAYALKLTRATGEIAATGPSITVAASGVAISRISAGCGSTEGGQTITIYGSGFATGATVSFGNVAATNVLVVNAETITATIPASTSAGAVRIVVTNDNGERATLTNAFRYASPFDPDGCSGMRRRAGSH
jgi:hypothetical protein